MKKETAVTFRFAAHAGRGTLAVIVLGLAPRAWAAEATGMFGSMLFPPSNTADFETHETAAPRAADPSIVENRARAAYILSKSSSTTWSIQQYLESFELSRSPIIPQTGVTVPHSLWMEETGIAYRRHIEDRRDWGISGSIGSASDSLYASIHETVFRATGFYRVPSKEQNSWLFLLSYSNNRPFLNNVPLPGVAYAIHSPEHGLDAMIGLPVLSVNYKPDENWSARASVFGPTNVSAEIGRTLLKPVQAYAGFDWNQRDWLRAGRTDNSDLLFYDEKKWSLGIRFPVSKRVRLDFAGGYEFDRRMYENHRAVSSGVPDVEFAPAFSFQAKLGIRW